MPRPTADQIRAKIQAALVQEVAEKGIGSVAMGLVAKRAGVSPGTIYLHFENKDDLLQKIYLKLKVEFHTTIMAPKDETDSAVMIRKMWNNMFELIAKDPFGFLFLESGSLSHILTGGQSRQIAHMPLEIAALLQRAIDDGTLADLPVSTVIVMLVAPAMHLARHRLLQGNTISQDELDRTFDRVWRSITD